MLKAQLLTSFIFYSIILTAQCGKFKIIGIYEAEYGTEKTKEVPQSFLYIEENDGKEIIEKDEYNLLEAFFREVGADSLSTEQLSLNNEQRRQVIDSLLMIVSVLKSKAHVDSSEILSKLLEENINNCISSSSTSFNRLKITFSSPEISKKKRKKIKMTSSSYQLFVVSINGQSAIFCMPFYLIPNVCNHAKFAYSGAYTGAKLGGGTGSQAKAIAQKEKDEYLNKVFAKIPEYVDDMCFLIEIYQE